MRIGKTIYTITGSTSKQNIHGLDQTFTDLEGKRGAVFTLIETAGCSRATLIAYGAMSHRTICTSLVHR